MKKAVAIYNPKSGLVKRVNQNLKDTITKIFNEYDYDVQIIITEYKGHAEEIMPTLSDDIDLVMSFGGDGTFNEIITGNVQRKKCFRLLIFHLVQQMILVQCMDIQEICKII